MGRFDVEYKSTLLTVRVTEDEMKTLDYLSDYLGKTKSDIIARACVCFLNMDDVHDSEEKKKREYGEHRTHAVHLRMRNSDMAELSTKSKRSGWSISQIIRKSIKDFEKFVRERY